VETTIINVDPPGPKAKKILDLEKRHISPSVSPPTALVWERGEGATIFDVDGNRYIDFTSGVLVTNAGHCHPKIVKAIQEQAAKLLNCYDSPHPVRAKLAQTLAGFMPEDLKRVLFYCSGSEVTDVSTTIARIYTGKSEIITFHGAFHGRLYSSLSLSGIGSQKRGLRPLAPGVIHMPYPYCYRCTFDREYPACGLTCLKYMERTIDYVSSGDIAALIMEPYQGTNGSIIPPPEFIVGVREFCSKRGILMILDEVQSSFGRTGKMFAFEHYGIVPDILCVAKGLAGGVPLSAIIARNKIMEALEPGSLSSTHTGSPISCAAALATIDVILEEGLSENAARVGKSMIDRLVDMQWSISAIGDIRGIGLAIGLELVKNRETREPDAELASRVVGNAIKKGLALISPIGMYHNIIRLGPPLVITEEMAMEGLDILEKSIVESMRNR
jgi:4-aminobutyrate aminotransferase